MTAQPSVPTATLIVPPIQLTARPGNQPGQLRSTRARGLVRVLETWFDDEPASLKDVDLWVSHQRSGPLSPGGWQYFYTIHVDLTLTPDQLMASMTRAVAREIRQIETKLGLRWTYSPAPTEEELEAYAKVFDENPRTPDQAPLDRARFNQLRAAGLLQMTQAIDPEGRALALHISLRHDRSGTIQAYSSVSLQNHAESHGEARTIGKIGRWLYFQEFVFFGAQGFRTFDLNGWYGGLEDQKRININQYKEGFGGAILYGYDCEEPVSLRGRLFAWLRAARRRLLQPAELKEFRRRRQKAPRRPEL